MKAYPEADKWSNVYKDAAIIKDFLEWAKRAHDLSLWKNVHDGEGPEVSYHTLVEQFFGVDSAKLEAERREILETIRVAR